jgi:AAA domain/Bifunctional DNA primase/polymerase, N-terminal
MTMTNSTELRLALRAAGHAPVPACGKAIYLQEWTAKGAASAEEIASWAIKHPDWSNTGVLCSKTPTLDIDLRNPEAAEAVADIVRDWFDGRGTLLTRTGEAPKRAIPFRTEQPFPKILVKFTKPKGYEDKPRPGIEMLAHGQQFIVDGVHPDTRRPYSWHAERNLLNTPRDDLPEINEAEAQSLVSFIVEMLVERFGFQIDTSADMEDGLTNSETGAIYDSDGHLDVEATLAAMQPSGASVNDIQPKVILSLLQRAVPPTEVVDRVVNTTMDMATRNGLPWTREVELKCVDRRVDCALRKLQGEYDLRTGEIPRWLAEEFHQKWADTLAKGGRPRLSRNRHNKHLFSVWAYGADKEEEEKKNPEEEKKNPEEEKKNPEEEKKNPEEEKKNNAPRRRFKLVQFCDLRPGMAEQPYLIDELIPAAGIVVVWGPPKCLKSFTVLGAMLHVAKGWEYRDRWVRQGTVVYCASPSRAPTAIASASKPCAASISLPMTTGSRFTSFRGKLTSSTTTLRWSPKSSSILVPTPSQLLSCLIPSTNPCTGPRARTPTWAPTSGRPKPSATLSAAS